MQAFLDVGSDETLAQAMQRLRATRWFRRSSGGTPFSARASAPRLRIVPDVPIRDRSRPWRLAEVAAHRPIEVFDEAALVARRQGVGLDEVLGETDDPRLEALAKCQVRRGPERDSTLPPPMSMTTAVPADVYAIPGRQVDEPGLFRSRNDFDSNSGLTGNLGNEIAAILASRVALVALATISSTLFDSARRLNFASVCKPADIADAVRVRPSSPPAPSRTMLFPVDDLE